MKLEFLKRHKEQSCNLTGREWRNKTASNAAYWQVYVAFFLFNFSNVYIFPYFHLSVKTAFLLTPLSRVLLQKLAGFQLVKKFPEFYNNRKFIFTFTSARHLSLFY
jgi:hypothetical protein